MDSVELTKRELIQQEALKATEGKLRCGLAISMGVGKTLIGLLHMQQHFPERKFRFLVVAPKISIFDSWKDEAVKFGLEYLLEYIDFTTYISLSKKSRDYDVVYLDECHSLLHSHDYFLTTYTGKILGLTGTPPRHKRSEKGIMVSTYCPIVYSYITDDAIDDKILNDYKIIIHSITLDTRKNLKIPTKNGGFFMTSELENYNYWTSRIYSATSGTQEKIFRIMRMKAMMTFKSKENYVMNLLDMMHEKCIVFCNTTEQADNICKYSYHSKNPNNDINLEKFKAGTLNVLSCVQQLNEGVNIPNLKSGIILHAYSNERKSNQRIGRLLRLNPDDKSTIHILMYDATVDVDWVSQALTDLDQTKITYTKNLC